MTRQRNDNFPATPEDAHAQLTQMLTLALIRLTSRQEGKGKTERWRSRHGYDPSVLVALSKMGLIELNGENNPITLTEQGLITGNGATLIVADAFDRMFEDAGQCETTPAPLDDAPRFDPLPHRVEGDHRAFLLRIELDLEGLFPCWREVLMPATCSFLDLHIVIQRIFNWYDEHLFNFEMVTHSTNLHMEEYAFQAPEDAFIPSGYALAEAREVLLGDVFPRSRTARYSYDYGDGWEHKIKLVKTLSDADVTAPQLMRGEGDAPPEDVGGPGGFEHFLTTISDPFNEECLDALKWGEARGYEPFDLAKKQRELAESFEDDRREWLEALAQMGTAANQPGSSPWFVQQDN